ncbi:MAG: ABC transporter ATP-binding protein [Treponema sp.]|nr:ABC transporter ATP-binding protein [Treponema sp.]
MSYFEATNLYKRWKSCTVQLSLSAEQGTLTAIVGPSGAGKSTVLSLVAGLVANDLPQECMSLHKKSAAHFFARKNVPITKMEDWLPAKIMLDGVDITNLPPHKRGCGMVFQNHSLFMHMTVQDNIGYGLRAHGMSKHESRKKARAFLERFHMESFAERWPETLSGGEAQRIALFRTLIVQPKLVLLDEPLSALDETLRKRLASEIRAMQVELGFTALMVTHDLVEAKSVSDSVVLIKNGKKSWEGPSTEFFPSRCIM